MEMEAYAWRRELWKVRSRGVCIVVVTRELKIFMASDNSGDLKIAAGAGAFFSVLFAASDFLAGFLFLLRN